MPKLLIADHSETRSNSLKEALSTTWEIHVHTDYYPVIDTIRYIKPDAMIVNLNIGSQNAFTVLEEAFPDLPPVILALTNFISPYVIKKAESLGVSMLMQIPCKTNHIKEQLEDMYHTYFDSSTLIKRHLQELGIDPTLTGYRCLLAAIPFFQLDPNLMIKEVYPEVAKLCGLTDWRGVEHCSRTAIQKAWKNKSPEVWDYYFPGHAKYPSNKTFILRIAQLL